jgi:dihydrofolate reductase
MGKVMFDMSMSLDGFINAANETPDVPLGEGGHILHDWMANESDQAALAQAFAGENNALGAVIMGRRNYDMSVKWWGGEGPVGTTPCFVLSHSVPAGAAEMFTFVSDGIHSALAQARAIAGDKHIGLMGADTQQQFINAGLVDDIHLNIVPILLGSGTRLFEHLKVTPLQLERLKVVELPSVTHLWYRIVK